MKSDLFEVMLASIDTRQAAIKCSPCNVTFPTRFHLENHQKKNHKEAKAENFRQKKLIETLVKNQMNQTNILDKLATSADGQKTTQITKAKQPPLWIGQTFENFVKEMENWDKTNKDLPNVKYNDLVESLKKDVKVKNPPLSYDIDSTTGPSTILCNQ